MDELKLMSVTEPVPMSETEPVVVEGRPVTMRKAKWYCTCLRVPGIINMKTRI